MKQLRNSALTLFVLLVFTTAAQADRLSLKGGFNQPFYTPNLEVEWTAPMDKLPRNMRVFRVVPGAYSPVVASNLMALGGFKPLNRVKAFRESEFSLPKDAFGFESADGRRSLLYYPRLGLIDYRDPTAFAEFTSDWKVRGVPNEQETFQKALQILKQSGLSTNEMATNAAGGIKHGFHTGSLGRVGGGAEIYLREVFFIRSLDGFAVDRHRTAFMEFGNDAKLGTLEVHWCKLRPKGSYAVASPAQMIQWIKKGRAMVGSVSGPTAARWVRVADIRKLTITGIELCYQSIDGEGVTQHAYPYALLTGKAEFGKNDSEQIYLSCPVIDEGLPEKQQPKEAYFSIYPSGRSRRQ